MPFFVVLSIATLVSFWYCIVLRPVLRPWSDAALLILLTAILLSGIFDWVYVSPIPKVSISVL